jgi:uncharacterized protein
MATLPAMVLAALIGVSLGLLGGGGSILAVPVLVYVAGIEPRDAVGMSLAVVGATSLAAGLLHRRSGQVDGRLAAVFGVLGIGGAWAGARLTRALRPELLLTLFALVMLAAGLAMLRRRHADAPGAGTPARGPRPLALVPVALGLGVLTGFLGVGGGFLIVPALVVFARAPMKIAVGTSLFVIAANSAAGWLAHLGEGDPHAALTAAFTALAILGSIAGERLARRSPPAALRRAFALLILALGAAILASNLRVLL